MIKKTSVLFYLILLVSCKAQDKSQATEKNNQPNIVFILADDWGWTDWEMNGGEFGSQFYETPNLNQLAKEGVYFNQAYAFPLCSPSRVALMTGKYPGARLHMHQAITGASVETPSISEALASNKKTCFVIYIED